MVMTPRPQPGVWRTRAAALVLILLATRLPLMGHPTPVHPDAALFVEAIGFPTTYPVHHPGYPLWIALGTLTAWLGLDGYAAFQFWSVLASVVAPIFLYTGLRWLVRDALAWWLAMAFGLNPVVWFTGCSALNYVAGGAVGLLVVGLFWKALAGPRSGMMRRGVWVLAIGLFLRPDLLMWLGPMLAVVAWRFRRRGGRTVGLLVAAAFVALLGLTAFIYGRADIGRPHPELRHTLDRVTATSVFRLGLVDGLVRNGVKLGVNFAWDFGAAVLLLVPAVLRHRRWCSRPPGVGPFVLLWTAPLLAFVLLIHMTEPGHILLLIPAGYVMIGLYLHTACGRRRAVRLAAAVAVCSAVQFLAWPWSSEGTGLKRLLDAKIAYLSAAGLRHIDQRPDIHTPGDFWPTAAHHGKHGKGVRKN